MVVLIWLASVWNTRDRFDGTIDMPRSRKRRRRVADNLRQTEKVRRKLNRNEESKEEKENESLCEQNVLVRDHPVIQTKDKTAECKCPEEKQRESEEKETSERTEGSWFAVDWGGIYNGLVQVNHPLDK